MKRDSCHNGFGKRKVRFETAADAHDLVWRKHRNDTMDVYKCPQCPYWHIGHRSQRPLPKRFYVGARFQEHDEALVGKLIGVLKEIING